MSDPIYNPFTGLLDEAAMRGGGPTESGPYTPTTTLYDGKVGGNTVQIYGSGAPMTDAQALAHLQGLGSTQSYMRNGAMPVEQWKALNPGATAAELKAYKQKYTAYQQSTKGTGGVGNSLHNAATFELDHIGNIFEGLTDPTRIFGIDPLTTKLGNAVFGTNNDPLVNQMGGATSKQIKEYEAKHGTNSAGGAQGLHNAAAGTAAIIAAGTLAHGGLTGGQGVPTTPYNATYNGNYATETLGMPGAEVGATGGGLGGAAAGAAEGALPEIVVTGTVGGGGLTAGELAAIEALGGAGLGAAVNSSVGTPNTGGSGGGSGQSSNPFMDFVKNNWQDILQQGAGALLGGGGGGSGGGGGGGGGIGGAPQGYTGQIPTFNGSPLNFPRSGFRDDNAYNYLLQTLGLPNPTTSPVQGTGMAAPDTLDSFATMDFSKAFAPLSSSPKMDPRATYTALNSGTRGPDTDPATMFSALAGTFGNGGAALGTDSPFKPRRVK